MLTNTERQQIVEEVNAGTYGIDEALDDIAAAQKGEEVRKALYAEALVLNREGHAGSTDMIARQQIANLQTSVNGQISTLRTEVGEDIDDLETAFNSGLAAQNGRIAAQNATIANVVANYNVEYGSTELWASTGETGALAAGTTVTLSEDVSHFDYIDIYSFCGNSNVLDTVPVDAKLQSSQGYALRWVNLSDPDSGSYKAYVRIIETRLHIIGTTLTIDHQVTYRNGEEVNISGAEITQSNRSTYMGELGIMKVVGRKITANTEIEDVRIGADGTEYASAGQAVRAQVTALESAIPAVDSTLSTQGAAADAKVAGDKVAELKSVLDPVKGSEETLEFAVYKKLGNGNKAQLTDSAATNIINIQNEMTIGHKYKIMLKFNNYTDSDFAKMNAFYVAIGTSGSDRKEDLISNVRAAIGGSLATGYKHIGEWVFIEYTATAKIKYLRPQYTSSYAPVTENSIDWAVYDLDAYNFADKGTEEIASKNATDIETINSELYNIVSSGNKTQGGKYGQNCISFGATLYAGKTYNISLKFNGAYSTFLTYLNNLYIATSDAATGRVEDIKSLFTAIESPLAVGKLYTVEYTPEVNVSYLGPAYSSNYSPSADNSIDYKVVEKESIIDQLEQKIGSDDFYNFTPINTWEENAVPSAITQKLNTMENDILGVFQGDSLTALIEYSGAQEEPEHCPPGMQYKSWTYWLWQNMARVKPLCDRLDSQRNGTDFFTKTGTWEQVDGTKFDAEGYTWDFARERSVACLTYQSGSDNAAVGFTFDADTYDKCNIVFSLKPDGADCEIEIAQGNGKMLVSIDRTTWVEANGFTHTQQSNPENLGYSAVQDAGLAIQQRHRRLWMKKASGVTGNITVTYKRASSSASGSYMYCWGVERWSGNTVFIDNEGRGGRYTRLLSYNISDIFDRNPDFAVYEMPLANETDEGMTNIYGFYQQYFTSDGNNSYKTRSESYTKVPLIVFLPHGRGVFFNADNAAVFDSTHQVSGDPPAYVIYMTIWNWLKEQLASYDNVSVINLYCRLLNEATGIGQPIKDVFGSNGEYAFTQDTVHLNSRGARMYCKYLLSLFQR